MLIAESTDVDDAEHERLMTVVGERRDRANLRHRLKPELILTEDNESALFRISAPVENVVSVW